MDRGRIDRWLERGILGLVLAVVVFAPLAMAAARLQDFAVVQALVAVATVLWALRFWVRPSHRIQWPPVCWPVAGFALYAVARYLTADVEYVARQELLRVLVCVWLFFVVLNNLHRQKNTELLVKALLVVGTLLSIYAIYQFLAKSNYVLGLRRPEQYDGRGSGTYICPNHLAGLLEMLIPVALAMLLLGKDKLLQRVFTGYAALVLLAGMAVTVSRGGYLACGLSLVLLAVFLVRFRNYRILALVSLVALLVGGGVFLAKSPQSLRRFTHMFVPGQLQHVGFRWSLTKITTRMWLDHFWVGVGPGHFDVRFPGYRGEGLQQRPTYAHNDYLQVLTDWGFVGGVLVFGAVGLLGGGVPVTWRYVRRSSGGLVTKRSDRAAHVLGVSVGLIALAIHTAYDFNLHVPANALVATVLAASLASHRRFSTRRFWISPRLTGRLVLTLLTLASASYLLPQAARQWREGRAILRADTAPTVTEQLTALHEAVEIEPGNGESGARLGEFYRLESWEGGANWQVLAEEALKRFDRAIAANPFDTYPYLRAGMTLDWLGRHDEAARRFERAGELDPNNYYVVMMRGWHELQLENYEDAARWFRRSLEIKGWANFLANNYLALAKQRLAERNR